MGENTTFDFSNIDDWDAEVDNVTLSFETDPNSPAEQPAPTKKLLSPYGICVHAPGGPELYTLFDEVQTLGVDWVRVDMHWFWVENSGKGQFNWDLYDVIVDAAEARGLSIYATIWATPGWATSGTPYKGVPDNPSDLYDFCFTAAQRYTGRIKYWGLWNEPNIGPANGSPHWEGTRQQFIDIILKIGADGIHAGNPDAQVGGPELAQQVGNWATWLNDCLDQAGDKFDFVTHHTYAGSHTSVTSKLESPTGNTNPALWDENNASTLPSVKEVLELTGWLGKPFWLTETGWLTNQVGETLQAQYFSGLLSDWFTDIPDRDWLNKIFFYELNDKSWETWEWGILYPDPDYTRKQAFFAYQQFIIVNPAQLCLFDLTGDINRDCFVDMQDFSLFILNWLLCNHSDPNLCP